ncbi:lymphocyte function-associated antigen 3 isoform X2 [Tamandua tetradactyla]|uniref:lymphocyte function-associated antigen 3 isoform X2 n=1 Tax=Tamandua tetradactyla TaxID=48850 RepID=UPI004053B964
MGVFGVLCLLLHFGLISCDTENLFGAVKGSVTFKSPPHTAFKEIIWKKHKDKVVEWEENSKVIHFPPFQERVHLDTVSGHLTIFNLTLSDEDHYEIESPSIKDNIIFFLSVVEPLPPLGLNCTLIGESIMLQCGLQKHPTNHPEFINYSWNCPSVQCQNNSETEVYFKTTDDLSKEIHCLVENKVSERKSSVVLATCVPEDHFKRQRMLIIASVALVIICIIVLLYMKVPDSDSFLSKYLRASFSFSGQHSGFWLASHLVGRHMAASAGRQISKHPCQGVCCLCRHSKRLQMYSEIWQKNRQNHFQLMDNRR